MALANIFTKPVSDAVIGRINELTPETQPAWGKMSVSQMLAHCCVTYEMVYDNIHPKPNFLMGFILKSFIKSAVTNEKPYPRNSRTAPAFLISDARDFEKEKTRLTDYINRTQALGEKYFDGKESHSFGKLNATEWNNMFYKHLNHHLTQFGV
jgi:PHD/YefM family antitoxin component YafN of YafNO toxin-antitoxin module